jgi:hypothetical protein
MITPASLDRDDLDGRDLVWLAILGAVARGPLPLGQLLMRVEHEVGPWTGGAAVARSLHEMARGGHIRLECDGARWNVAAGPRAEATLDRLMGRVPSPHLGTIRKAYVRLCRLIGIDRSAYAT